MCHGIRRSRTGKPHGAQNGLNSLTPRRFGGKVTTRKIDTNVKRGVMVEARELMAQAQAETGLSDFGEDGFREGLDRLLSSLGTEANLNSAGEAVIYPRLVTHLSQRLQVEDWYARHPEIEDVPVEAPLLGVGLPRTGSTVLSFLLACDPGVRYLRRWEATTPCPPPSTVEGPDPRRDVDDSGGRRRHVPTGVDGPMECLDLQALEFQTPLYEAFARIPSYSQWVADTDITPAYLYERRVLKLLAWGEPVRPWRLKAPTHAQHLPALMNAFPDAKFVMTHRDPTDVLGSVCDVFADIQANFTDELDRLTIGRTNEDRWVEGMRRVLQFRADPQRDALFYDLHFRAVAADPIGEVRGLYDWLGVPVSEQFEKNMAEWTEANNEREPNPRTPPESFGLDLDALRPKFADYVEHMSTWTNHKEHA